MKSIDTLTPCPCGNPAGYTACCGPLHDGAPAATAEQLSQGATEQASSTEEASASMEQLHRKALLQAADLLADGRLADAEQRRGLGEAAGAGHGVKGAQPLVVLVHEVSL